MASHAADDARGAATVSTGAFVAGGALLATAAVLYFTSPVGAEARRGAIGPTWRVAVSPAGVAWDGTF